MNRRPLVTVAALACAVPFWEDVWLWVAYEEIEHASRLVYYSKRAQWLPGDAYRLPDQACRECVMGNCIQCIEGWGAAFCHSSCTGAEGHIGPVIIAQNYGFQLSVSHRLETTHVYCTCPTCYAERER